MRKIYLLLTTLFLTATLPMQVLAKDIPAKPNPPRLVNDYTQTLSTAAQQQLEQKLVAYFDSTSTQIAIIIEQSLDGDDLFDYCQRLATGWGIGEQNKNNGLLIYIALADRKIRIHTGYGMEATITDALSKRIIEKNIKPNFKAGNYYQGLDEATDIIIQAASGEYEYDRTQGNEPNTKAILKIIFIIIIIIIVISKFGGGRGGRRGSGFGGPIFWGGTFGSGGFSSGGGGFGGGGFGGFGGGGFGGGGSSGSW